MRTHTIESVVEIGGLESPASSAMTGSEIRAVSVLLGMLALSAMVQIGSISADWEAAEASYGIAMTE